MSCRKRIAAIVYDSLDEIPAGLKRAALVRSRPGLRAHDLACYTPGISVPNNLIQIGVVVYEAEADVPDSVMTITDGDIASRVTDVPYAEALALVDLYNRTKGASWTNKTNWLQTTTVGNWFGVTVAGGHVTVIDLNTNNLVGSLTGWAIGNLVGLTNLTAYTNTGLTGGFALSQIPATMQILWLAVSPTVITGALSDLPAGMTYLVAYETSSAITGALSDLPAGMTYLVAYSTSSAFTGALSDLPAGMTYLSIGGTSSAITGGAVPMADVAMQNIHLYSTARTQAHVDEIVDRIYTDRALFTYATPALNVGGTNAAPSGVYQLTVPPTTGKEKIYWLVNDPLLEGFKKWAITYTA